LRDVLGVEVHLAQLAQPVEAVALGVGLVVGGHDAQLGAGLGVEQHQQPVEVAQALAGQLVGVDARFGVEVCLASVERRWAMTSLARISMLSRGCPRAAPWTPRRRACGTCRPARRARSGRRRHRRRPGGGRRRRTGRRSSRARPWPWRRCVRGRRRGRPPGNGPRPTWPAQPTTRCARPAPARSGAARRRRTARRPRRRLLTIFFLSPWRWPSWRRRPAEGWSSVGGPSSNRSSAESARPASRATSHRPVPVSTAGRRRHREPVGGVAHQVEHLTVGLEAERLEHHVVEVLDRCGCTRSPVASLAVALVLKNRPAAPFRVVRADGSPLPSASSHALRSSPRSPPMTASR
jgi:hypothetical protein